MSIPSSTSSKRKEINSFPSKNSDDLDRAETWEGLEKRVPESTPWLSTIPTFFTPLSVHLRAFPSTLYHENLSLEAPVLVFVLLMLPEFLFHNVSFRVHKESTSRSFSFSFVMHLGDHWSYQPKNQLYKRIILFIRRFVFHTQQTYLWETMLIPVSFLVYRCRILRHG